LCLTYVVKSSVFPELNPAFPWIGRDLQTLRNFLSWPRVVLEGSNQESLFLDTYDGSTDQITGFMHRPCGITKPKTIVLLVHGMAGSADSIYVKMSAAYFLSQNIAVVRLNLRGAGSSGNLCQRRYHAGFTQDFPIVIQYLRRCYPQASIVMMGFSLGGNIILKWLTDSTTLSYIDGAISVSAPLNLSITQQEIARWRNIFYHKYLLACLKKEFLSVDLYQNLAYGKSIKTIHDFDQHIIAKAGGFHGADDYYLQTSAINDLPKIQLPLLLIHAQDDPWIPMRIFENTNLKQLPHIIPLFPKTGGHLGFHDQRFETPWYNICSYLFIQQLRV